MQEERLDVFQYHTTACFSGFDDDDDGFYTVYRKVFEQIAQEERRAAETNSSDDTDDEFMYPRFGTKQSDFDSVVGRFYGFWEGFTTRKSYVWVEKYDARDAPNRPTKRAMEAENKKLRDAARKERNQEVRELVRFVRNRDKRVAAQRRELEERRQANERKAREKQAAQREAHLREAAGSRQAAWTDMSQFEEELCRLEAERDGVAVTGDGVENGEEHNQELTSEEAEDDEDLYCLVCEKVFRSERQLENHERSKKHRDRLAALQCEMLADESLLFGGSGVKEQTEEDAADGVEDATQMDVVRRSIVSCSGVV